MKNMYKLLFFIILITLVSCEKPLKKQVPREYISELSVVATDTDLLVEKTPLACAIENKSDKIVVGDTWCSNPPRNPFDKSPQRCIVILNKKDGYVLYKSKPYNAAGSVWTSSMSISWVNLLYYLHKRDSGGTK